MFPTLNQYIIWYDNKELFHVEDVTFLQEYEIIHKADMIFRQFYNCFVYRKLHTRLFNLENLYTASLHNGWLEYKMNRL